MSLKEKSVSELTTDIQALESKIAKIKRQASNEGRGLSASENSLVSDMVELCHDCDHEIKSRPSASLTMLRGGNLLNGGGISRDRSEAFGLVGPNGRKDYHSLFGNGGPDWTDKDINFFSAVFGGRYHPGLIKNSMSETVPSDGGFLIPSETASRIHAVSLESELILPRCYLQPMQSNEIKIPAMVVGDHSSALFGGFSASYTAELGTISENSPKARSMELHAKKLTGLIRFSSELQMDTLGGMNQIETLCGKGLGFYRDRAFLKGTGAGQPLGILNSGCLVEVDPEDGQSEKIIYENLTKMVSRMFAGSFSNSIFICHQTTIPSLLEMSISIGLSGNHIPVMSEKNGQFTILTRPVLFTEKTETLGTKGDIMLCDLSQYVVGLRSGMRFDSSIHVHFETDELLSRIIERHDGQPLWDSALTLEDGSTTVSPFVVLGDR